MRSPIYDVSVINMTILLLSVCLFFVSIRSIKTIISALEKQYTQIKKCVNDDRTTVTTPTKPKRGRKKANKFINKMKYD